MTATCPVDPTHRAFRQSGGDGIACMDCQKLTKAKIARGNKYGAVRVETPLGMADSKKEGRRLGELRLMEMAGEISGLVAHPKFELKAWSPSGFKVIGKYTADAQYIKDGRLTVEDVKSEVTARRADYRLRIGMFLSNNPHIDFRET